MADINSIVDKVLERSEQDRINWRPTVTANTFVASIGNLGVSISIPRSTVVDSIARFRVIDDRGQTIQDLSVDNIDNPHIHTKLMKIHSKARQIASNNDPRLEELLEELDRV
jgi:hypothetical protein